MAHHVPLGVRRSVSDVGKRNLRAAISASAGASGAKAMAAAGVGGGRHRAPCGQSQQRRPEEESGSCFHNIHSRTGLLLLDEDGNCLPGESISGKASSSAKTSAARNCDEEGRARGRNFEPLARKGKQRASLLACTKKTSARTGVPTEQKEYEGEPWRELAEGERKKLRTGSWTLFRGLARHNSGSATRSSVREQSDPSRSLRLPRLCRLRQGRPQ